VGDRNLEYFSHVVAHFSTKKYLATCTYTLEVFSVELYADLLSI